MCSKEPAPLGIKARRLSKGAVLALSLCSRRAAALTVTPTNSTSIQLIVTNGCGESIWPGIVSQNGIGPEAGGFELTPHSSRVQFVSPDWEGRVWGRTNCSFNSDGSGPSTPDGVNGYGAACLTGDCSGKLNCQFAGQVPTTIAEFTLQGGSSKNQTFYDISLVDGYNLPLAIIHHPSPNNTWIPPNLTNCACIASAGHLSSSPSSSAYHTNTTYPMPYEPAQTNDTLQTWCPFDLQKFPLPNKPGNGIFPYPDDSLPRPAFQPCLSKCSATNAPRDCCTAGSYYHSPATCEPSLYSRRAKRVCPDAYSYAYNDGASTFVVPSSSSSSSHQGSSRGGGGWEVRFCPGGRSTDILGTFGDEVATVGAGRGLSAVGWERVRDRGFVDGSRGREVDGNGAVGVRVSVVLGVVVVVVMVALTVVV